MLIDLSAGSKITVNSSVELIASSKADAGTSYVFPIAFVSNSEALALILNPPPTIVVAKATEANLPKYYIKHFIIKVIKRLFIMTWVDRLNGMLYVESVPCKGNQLLLAFSKKSK
ncbi:hypothetical protein I6G82_21150 [Lysinibacillus macroides]|uniref:Uncharacterized protein n=1 Tax=Lysinibacillus macroides TaxID=33935 RepID=A0A0N0CUS8_9BACI|nr:hypothetical protein [Lysinibacillus macroides]KOY80364.1 hypothetical protein ADM90_21235 [Lysinibacillus macroides]QPR67673.1 hypothetical protein I6G82_21150 [Lysinibacillus macroides]